MTYADKLKDPRWQKKRLEVFDANKWTCEQCGIPGQTLHAHHKRYQWGKDPWDYNLIDLACLCEDCHKQVSIADDILKGKHKNKEIQEAAYGFKYMLGLLLSGLDESEYTEALNFLSGAVSDISPPARFERDMHTRPLSEMVELLLQDSIAARRSRQAQQR
jgi:hypothetical protein